MLEALLADIADAAAFHEANGLVLRNPRVANMLDCPSVSLPLPVAGMPVGLMLIGRRGADRRLLEIAVALALEPACFLLDEPMAGMGAEGVGTLVQFLRALKQQAPILLVEHDMDAVFALADRISVLVYGRVIATGSVDQIRNDPQVREAYLGEETP